VLGKDVVALLKVDVLKEVAPNRARGNGVDNIDARHMRDRAFDRPQALAKYSSIVGLNDD